MVYTHFVHYARQVKEAGYNKYSVYTVMHRVRWHIQITTKGDHFKLNNNYASRYARLIEAQEPDLIGFFNFRRLQRP